MGGEWGLGMGREDFVVKGGGHCGREVQEEKARLKEGEGKVGKVVSITGQAQAHGGCLGDTEKKNPGGLWLCFM